MPTTWFSTNSCLVAVTLTLSGWLTSSAVAVRADPRAALADKVPSLGRLVTEDGERILTTGHPRKSRKLRMQPVTTDAYQSNNRSIDQSINQSINLLVF